MAEYIDREKTLSTLENTSKYYEMPNADEWTKGIHYGLIHGVDNIVDNVPTADVIERAEYDKLYEEHLKAIHRHTECLKELHELRSKIDKAIEEINDLNLSWVASHYEDRFYGFQQEVLEILKRNIGD